MTQAVARVRFDALPENANYGDDGCDYHPACLTCPFAVCRYDAPDGIRGVLNAERDTDLVRLRAQGVSVSGLARRFGISRRTVFRILAARALTPSLGTSPWTTGNPVQGGGDGMSETRLTVWCAKCAKVHPAPSCLRQERKGGAAESVEQSPVGHGDGGAVSQGRGSGPVVTVIAHPQAGENAGILPVGTSPHPVSYTPVMEDPATLSRLPVGDDEEARAFQAGAQTAGANVFTEGRATSDPLSTHPARRGGSLCGPRFSAAGGRLADAPARTLRKEVAASAIDACR